MSKEKPSTKICKHCKSEIPYGAKVCPNCRKKQVPGCLTIILAIIVIFIVVSIATSGGSDEKDQPVSSSEATTSAEIASTEVAEEIKDTEATEAQTANSDISVSKLNALSKAGDYLNYTAFSHDGLVEQLKYEGFSEEDATYAADNCGADWNEQSAKKAQEYMDYSSFSRSELIDQLEYEGFTSEQAEYGVKAVGY